MANDCMDTRRLTIRGEFEEMNVSAAISDAVGNEFDLEAVSVTRVLIESLNDSFWKGNIE
jgi:hypothetical protein